MRFLSIAALLLANVVIFAQTHKTEPGSIIQGIVQSENLPIPGVTVTATNKTTGERVSTSTDPNGQYHIQLPMAGAYLLETTMTAFAPAGKETTVQEHGSPLRLDFNLTLASRAPQQTAPQQAAARPAPAEGFRGRGGRANRGAQRLQLQQTTNTEQAGEAPADALELGWAHGALLATFPGDTTMATLEQVKALAKGGSARIQR